VPETKEEKFIRLAQKRVTRALRDIRLIGNLGSYPHTGEQAAKITSALVTAVDVVAAELSKKKAERAEATTFELK
jgi:hypothetical protein